MMRWWQVLLCLFVPSTALAVYVTELKMVSEPGAVAGFLEAARKARR